MGFDMIKAGMLKAREIFRKWLRGDVTHKDVVNLEHGRDDLACYAPGRYEQSNATRNAPRKKGIYANGRYRTCGQYMPPPSSTRFRRCFRVRRRHYERKVNGAGFRQMIMLMRERMAR